MRSVRLLAVLIVTACSSGDTTMPPNGELSGETAFALAYADVAGEDLAGGSASWTRAAPTDACSPRGRSTNSRCGHRTAVFIALERQAIVNGVQVCTLQRIEARRRGGESPPRPRRARLPERGVEEREDDALMREPERRSSRS